MSKEMDKKIGDALSGLSRASMKLLQTLDRNCEMYTEAKKIDEAIDEMTDAFDESCHEE